jgi:hypothetical protein
VAAPRPHPRSTTKKLERSSRRGAVDKQKLLEDVVDAVNIELASEHGQEELGLTM